LIILKKSYCNSIRKPNIESGLVYAHVLTVNTATEDLKDVISISNPLYNLVQKYSYIFKVPTLLPPIREVLHEIKLIPGAQPYYRSLQHLPPNQYKALCEEI
jgi:hypothetical protein